MINSAEEFVRLRVSGNRHEYSLAAGSSAPISVWFDIVVRYPEMKEWVVHNRNVPLEVLELLAVDPDSHIRAAVAEKPKLSLHLFELLSRDTDEIVRHRIAYNKKTPMDVLARLAEDDLFLIRDAARKRLNPFRV